MRHWNCSVPSAAFTFLAPGMLSFSRPRANGPLNVMTPREEYGE